MLNRIKETIEKNRRYLENVQKEGADIEIQAFYAGRVQALEDLLSDIYLHPIGVLTLEDEEV